MGLPELGRAVQELFGESGDGEWPSPRFSTGTARLAALWRLRRGIVIAVEWTWADVAT